MKKENAKNEWNSVLDDGYFPVTKSCPHHCWPLASERCTQKKCKL